MHKSADEKRTPAGRLPSELLGKKSIGERTVRIGDGDNMCTGTIGSTRFDVPLPSVGCTVSIGLRPGRTRIIGCLDGLVLQTCNSAASL